MLIKNLIEFGFSEKEAKTYIALLELEVATASEIARRCEINRSSTYVVLESLKRQGFVNVVLDKTIKQYVATQPEMLLKFAKKRAEKQEEIKTIIENIMPDLKALHKGTKHKPRVMVFEGKDSLKALYFKEISLKFNDKWRIYENPIEMDEYLPGFIEKDCLERKRIGVGMRCINPNTEKSQEIVARYKKMKSPDEIMLIPTNKFKSPKQPIDFAVHEDEITFRSLKESFAIVIKHQEIADTLKNIFDLAWKEAKRLNQYK